MIDDRFPLKLNHLFFGRSSELSDSETKAALDLLRLQKTVDAIQAAAAAKGNPKSKPNKGKGKKNKRSASKSKNGKGRKKGNNKKFSGNYPQKYEKL